MLILAKKKQKMLKLCFYLIHLNLVKTPKFNTMQKTSTWQTHLPYLQVETLLQYRIHQSYTGNYHCMHWLSKTPSWVTKQVWCARNSPWSLPMGPRSHQCVNKQTKNCFFFTKICLLTLILGHKNWLHDQFCAAKLATSEKLCYQWFSQRTDYARSEFLVATNNAKWWNYGSKIYQNLMHLSI